ncbi:MAG: SUMF1/EgtB/PvdO family nonheme iron enzyme [Alphaproteobacteria bacterium]|nr:SUMF1/EgtB/PvdO family nonheme iron enzyme [Alphaproteobacteria bacterium]
MGSTDPALEDTRWSLDGRPVARAERLDLEREAGNYEIGADHPHFEPARQTVELKRGELTEAVIVLEPVAGRLVIDSVPDGATVEIDGASAGVTPFDAPAKGGSYTLRVAAPDRVALEDTVEVTNTAPVVARRYNLKPFPATISVLTIPEGGQLLVDGRQVSANRKIEISANEDHVVTYLLDGYRAKSETVRLGRDEHRDLTFRLQEALGIVDVRTTPGAEIVIDGRVVGIGEIELQLLSTPHTLELRKPGYRAIKRTITPSEQRTLVIRDELITETAARLAEAPRTYTNSAGISLSLFEPGLFKMGAPRSEKGQRANEFLKTVRLRKPFYAARHEVTNAQYAEFSGQRRGPAKLPVTGVSWIDAAAFSNWLSEREGLPPFYRISGGRLTGVDRGSDGYRLLSEAEWEWLARMAGRETQTIFGWGDGATIPRGAGNIADESANGIVRTYVPNYNDGHAQLAPVGSYPAEPSGLHDLTGNASEWVHDFYSLVPPNKGELFVDPLGPERGQGHVVKGSSWQSGTRTKLRPAYREGLTSRRDDIGFRVGRYLHGAQ